MADRVLPILIRSNLIKIKKHLSSSLSLRVCLRQSLGRAERYFEKEGIEEFALPNGVRNLPVCFGFPSSCFASRNDSFLWKSFVVMDSI